MKQALSLLTLLIFLFGHQAVFAQTKKIQDNSFLIEEAYNQEDGVIQHIQGFLLNHDSSWTYAFTQEWPVPKRAHQLSYTIPVVHLSEDGGKTGFGDIALNYRYQLILRDPVALAPRFSLLFPTGNFKRGLGSGAFGLQWNIPLSVEVSEKWVTHWNAGLTFIPRAKGISGTKANTLGYNLGASIIWLALENFNPMFETIWVSDESVQDNGSKTRENRLFINPGFRVAINLKSGLQIVPGISAPIGLGPSNKSKGVFFYLSFEHPLF